MKIVIVDDDAFVTTSLVTILSAEEDVEIVGVGNSGAEAIELYCAFEPDILLMDIQMGEMSGLEAAEQILAESPKARIVFLTTFADDEYIVAALRMGANGYLIKQEVATIAPALRTIMSGQSVMGNEVLRHVDELMKERPLQKQESERNNEGSLTGELATLSKRELEIVELVAKGLDNKDISNTLYISEGTVRNHISVILAKLALKNRTQLAILYYKS